MALQMDSTETPIGLVGKGMLAGVAGTAAMTFAQTKLLPRDLLAKIPSGYEPKEPRYPSVKGEPVTEVTARRFMEGVARRPLRGKAKTLAGYLVHFGTGAACGAILGLLAPKRLGIRQGLLFGTIVWALNDNLFAPALRLSDWPSHYPIGAHVGALLAHLVYGAGTALALDRVLH